MVSVPSAVYLSFALSLNAGGGVLSELLRAGALAAAVAVGAVGGGGSGAAGGGGSGAVGSDATGVGAGMPTCVRAPPGGEFAESLEDVHVPEVEGFSAAAGRSGCRSGLPFGLPKSIPRKQL